MSRARKRSESPGEGEDDSGRCGYRSGRVRKQLGQTTGAEAATGGEPTSSSALQPALPPAGASVSMPGDLRNMSAEWQSITNPIHLSRNPETGDFFVINQLQHSGLTSANEKRLFVSAKVMQLFQVLENFMSSTERVLAVNGAPGLGKSCTTWAWACKTGLHDGKQVLWVHVAKFMTAACVSFSNKSCTTCSLRAAALDQLLQTSKAEFIVFDGYSFKMGDRFAETLSSLMEKVLSSSRKVIFVSSLGGNLRAKDLSLGDNDVERFEMKPWTLEEYIAACTDRDFCKSVRVFFESTVDETISKDLIQDKYYYAGASARWMFGMDTNKVMNEIETYFSEVKHPEAMLDLTLEASSIDSSNHLLMRTRGKDGGFESFFVSKYALLCALNKFRTKGIVWSYQLAASNRNRSHFGWVLELDFVTKILAACKGPTSINLLDQSNTAITWQVPHATKFDQSLETLDPWALDHWMIPNSSREAGLDAACLYKAEGTDLNILRVVQVTCGLKHSLRMDSFARLISRIVSSSEVVISGLEVIFLLPKFVDRELLRLPS